ncbi:MAG TPA: hypothetical protein VNM47_19985 [Terriglobia bacterium]|nr:hypothetical protein [Terriglobia bacterium]
MNRRRFLKDGLLYSGMIAARGWSGAHRPALLAQNGGQPSNLGAIDLKDSVVVAPEGLSRREQKAVQLLIEEVEKRTGLRWPVASRFEPGSNSHIVVGSDQALKQAGTGLPRELLPEGKKLANPEGYHLRTTNRSGSTVVTVSGAGERGVLFGVGGLLRSLRMSKQKVSLDGPLDIATSPKYKLRGHQLGYRPKTNSYDGWNVPMWDQYIRDLAVFGTNAVELIPPRSDDQPDSPHFPLPPMQMMVEMSRLADKYGLDVWIWYPAMDKDYSNPETVEFAVHEWGEVFKALPRVDAVMVPGGDPGHTEPKVMMALLEKQTQNLRRYHPRAEMWMSPQSFDEGWMKEFFEIVDRQPAWLSGVVYGPQVRIDVSTLRQRLPDRYPIRLYPDITHSVECQFPVPDWDLAYALTEGREVINPRPLDYADIFHIQAPHSIGFLTYSEGCNDDVNKILWSSLGWDPERPIIEILREYSGYFISDRLRDGFAQGVLSLQENWRGALLSNKNVATTLAQFRDMEGSSTPGELENWRLQMALYRAYYDAFVLKRLVAETHAEERAMAVLGEIRRVGVRPNPLDVGDDTMEPTSGVNLVELLDRADKCLNEPFANYSAQNLRTRILELGEALFQSIHMQLAVERYQAEAVSRGANLDTLDVPLNDAPWLKHQFTEIRKLASYNAQYKAILEILHRTDPGPGGFYDNLGDLSRQPHLVRGPGPTRDPEFRHSALVGHGYPEWSRAPVPMAWKCWAESLFDAPLQMQYQGLDPNAQYKVRVVYSGDAPHLKIRLDCNEKYTIHPLVMKPWPPRSLEFDVPREATAAGNLTLTWHREAGLGHNGRGCQVAEVWLIRK